MLTSLDKEQDLARTSDCRPCHDIDAEAMFLSTLWGQSWVWQLAHGGICAAWNYGSGAAVKIRVNCTRWRVHASKCQPQTIQNMLSVSVRYVDNKLGFCFKHHRLSA